eukprot:3297766-Prymnesium_polylepis.5
MIGPSAQSCLSHMVGPTIAPTIALTSALLTVPNDCPRDHPPNDWPLRTFLSRVHFASAGCT